MTTLPFPEEVLKQHSVFLGKTGSGKSSKCRLVVEHLLDNAKRVCIIDPKGDWWGLKSTADGKSVAYPDVVMFGNFTDPDATDIPINKHSGVQVAELVASGNRPCVIGFSGWFASDMVQFWIDFASTLFAKNRGELFLFLDEFHNFAPKGKIMDPQAGKCLHWSNRLLSEGRGLGIVCLMASQRPQKVHNDALTSAETLFALRMVHAADRGAVEDWIKGCGDLVKGKEILNSLAGMKREYGYVWSPEIEFGPEQIKFPMFRTFDSFAPPQLQKQVSKAGWKGVDLTEVKNKMAKLLEEHKANDPYELKLQLAHAEKAIRRLQNEVGDALNERKTDTVEKPVFSEQDRELLRLTITTFENTVEAFNEYKETTGHIGAQIDCMRAAIEQTLSKYSLQPDHRAILNKASRVTLERPMSERTPAPMFRCEIGNDLPKMTRAFLTILAQYDPTPLTKGRMLALTEYAASGPVSTTFANLVRSGHAMAAGNGLRITARGLQLLGPWEPLPTGERLRDNVMNGNRLNTMEKAFMRILFDTHPEAMAKKDLLATTFYAASGPVSTAFARLVRLEFAVQDGRGLLRAHDNFFS